MLCTPACKCTASLARVAGSSAVRAVLKVVLYVIEEVRAVSSNLLFVYSAVI